MLLECCSLRGSTGELEASPGVIMGGDGFWDPWGQGEGTEQRGGVAERARRWVGADSGHRGPSP